MVRNGPPHSTAAGTQSVLIADNNALLLGPGNGHVDAARVEHESAEHVAAANRGDNHHVRVRPLAGVHLQSISQERGSATLKLVGTM